jgi:hypothetical protein
MFLIFGGKVNNKNPSSLKLIFKDERFIPAVPPCFDRTKSGPLINALTGITRLSFVPLSVPGRINT